MKNYLFLLGFTVMFTASLFLASPRASEQGDGERLAQIEKMYSGYRDHFRGISEVSADSLIEWVDSGEVVIVDVREKAEREVSSLPNSITPDELTSLLEGHLGQRIVIYCTIGYRSGKFTSSLKKKGVEAYNLEGGILAWVHHGGPIEHEGSPTRRVHVYGKKWKLLPDSYEPVW